MAALLAGAHARPAACGPVYCGGRGEIRLVLPRVAAAPVVDGALDDSVWAQAAVLDSFVHHLPVDGVRDTLGTRCLAMYDGQNLYVGFRCPDIAGGVRAPLTPRDKVDEGDLVAVSLDTYYDFQRAMVFGANPRGVQIDGVDTDADGFDDAPDFQFRSRGRVTAAGYEVEMAIPFRSLRFPESDTVRFGFNAMRYVSRDNVTMFWAPISRGNISTHAEQGTLSGLHAIRPGRNLEVMPGITFQRRGELSGVAGDPPGRRRLDFGDPRSRLSLDARSAVGTSFTAAATLNPDFSQIEADASVVDVNQRFAIYYPEKRPFFLEGGDLFATPIGVVYTRRIVDPRYGLKLAGRSGAVSLAALQALDRSAGESVATLPDALNPYFERDAAYGIVRLRRDLWTGSNVGLLAGAREQRETYNRGAGVDARLLWREHWRLSGQAIGSWSRERDYRDAFARLTPAESAALDTSLLELRGARRAGHAWHAELQRETRALETGAALDDDSRHFAADMGYIPRVNQVAANAWLAPHLYATGPAWYTAIHPYASYQRIWEHGTDRWAGRLTDDLARLNVSAELPQATVAGAEVNHAYTFFSGREFRDQVRMKLWGSSERWNAVRFGGSLETGDAVIFEEAVAGRSVDYQLWAHLRPDPALKFELQLTGSTINRRETGLRFANVAIPRLKVQYQFTRELAVRAIGELTAERHFDTSGVPGDTQHRATLDLLFSYLLRPGCVVYLGHGSSLEGPAIGATRPAASNLFFKLSWLWQG